MFSNVSQAWVLGIGNLWINIIMSTFYTNQHYIGFKQKTTMKYYFHRWSLMNNSTKLVKDKVGLPVL